MYRGRKIGIAVPAHNEEELIIQTLSGMPDYVDRIYVCNDASKDHTKDKVMEYMKKDRRVFLVDHEINTGVGGAIIDCHKKALEEDMFIVAVMAGDDQMDSDYLPALLDPLIDGKADYTKGNRLFANEIYHGMNEWRVAGNKLLSILTKFVTGNWNINDPQNGYTAITADALRKLPLDNVYKGYLFENDMLVKLNGYYFRILDVPIPARYGNEKSGINYYSFISKGLLFMMTSLIWRLNIKYFSKDVQPKVLLYYSGMVMTFMGSLIAFVLFSRNFLIHHSLFDGLVVPAAVTTLGVVLYALSMFMKKTYMDGESDLYDI